MKRILLASLVLISASGWAIAEDLHGTLYKNQSCQCCESHAKYLRENGIDVDVVPVPNYAEISEQAGVPSALQGCHLIKLMMIPQWWLVAVCPQLFLRRYVRGEIRSSA